MKQAESTVTYEKYKKFTDIPQKTRILILRKLGISAGTMRSSAKLYNPFCMVAFDGENPIAWCTLHLWAKHGHSEINVFVSSRYRRKGIGSYLVNEIIKERNSSKKTDAFPYNYVSKCFFSNFKEEITT